MTSDRKRQFPRKADGIGWTDRDHSEVYTRGRDVITRVGLPMKGMSEKAFSYEVTRQIAIAREIDRKRGTAAGRRQAATRIVKAAKKLALEYGAYRASYGIIPAFSPFLTNLLDDQAAQAELEAIRQQFELEAKEAAQDLRENKGFRKFVSVDLAQLFEKAFEQPARVVRGEDGSSKLKEVYGGPFVDFVQAIIVGEAGGRAAAGSIFQWMKRRRA